MSTQTAPAGAISKPERRSSAIFKRSSANPRRQWRSAYGFVLPGLLLYMLWTVYPLVYQLYISFFDWRIMPGQTSTFIGFANYERAFADRTFWLAMQNTLVYALITVVGQMLIGFTLALLVNRVFIGKRVFRAIYYLPVVTSWVVVSFLWLYLFNAGNSGLINYVLMSLGIIPESVSWLASSSTSWIAIYTLGIWKGMGWAMVIFLAALQSIPTELYEAAAIDGADEWGRIRHITLPLMRRTVVFVLIALMIGGFQVFVSVLLMTGGGPLHRTEVALTYMFGQSFGDLNFGYGAALSYILAAVIIIVSFVQMRLFKGRASDVEY